MLLNTTYFYVSICTETRLKRNSAWSTVKVCLEKEDLSGFVEQCGDMDIEKSNSENVLVYCAAVERSNTWIFSSCLSEVTTLNSVMNVTNFEMRKKRKFRGNEVNLL